MEGIITLNGEPIEGVSLNFVPRAMIRPSVAQTDSSGRYRARFVSTQSGVALGPCVVELSIYRGDSPRNYLPKQFNLQAEANPDFNLEVTESGLVFNYDIVYAGDIPPN
ncbi:Ig-like domain-containing protein [Blastopirellula sp. JC732]|uniref:Ig-like domain-containing protein n=1 Tax=Blastopirellula sediminis TaxID=2894196 RepID=A0A9X1SEN7_9BACT|nr:Ig-like domain-containing protein [Blastopirellula sediminis]MCC9628045.1 Ig-like domain-containing protein [Blastopirellula sediminis]